MSRPALTLATLLLSLTVQAEPLVPPPAAPVTEAAMLPVLSERLSPGPVAARSLNIPGLLPFFLVGDDPLSLAWLGQRLKALRDLGAVGLAVQVADAEALRRIRAAAPSLNIQPVSGDDLALRLRLQHYPVLITATAVEQ